MYFSLILEKENVIFFYQILNSFMLKHLGVQGYNVDVSDTSTFLEARLRLRVSCGVGER